MRTIDAWMQASSGDVGYMRHRYRIAHEAGHYVWIELIASLIKDPISAKAVKAIGLARDISDEMAAIHRIEVSEQNLVRSQAVARIGSWVHDLATGTSEWTDQMYVVFDLDKSEPMQDFETLFAVIQDDHVERWTEAFDKAAGGHTVQPFEINITARDGRTRRIRTHIDPEYDGDGNVARLHGICQDITDQRLMERKFLQAQKMEAVGRLTGGIAHDFNNLLMVVMGNLQLTENAVHDDPKVVKRIRSAMDAATRGSELTRRLLAFSRQQTLEDEDIDVNALVLDTRDMLIRTIGEQIRLEIKTSEDVWPIATDRTQLETALLNLAINARHAMEQGGTLTIETANAVLSEDDVEGKVDMRPGEYVLIRVTDTGHGMPPEIIDKVIQPFFTTKGPEAGSGLGLSMIYGFATQSGGHLSIASEVGVGTSMSIYLPRLGAAKPAVALEAQWDDQKATGPHDCHPASTPLARQAVVAEPAEVETEAVAEPEFEAASQPQPEPTLGAEPQSQPEPTASAGPKPEPEPTVSDVSAPEPQPDVSMEPEAGPEPTVDVTPEPQQEPTASVEPQPEPEPEPTVDVTPEPQPEPSASVEPQPEPASGGGRSRARPRPSRGAGGGRQSPGARRRRRDDRGYRAGSAGCRLRRRCAGHPPGAARHRPDAVGCGHARHERPRTGRPRAHPASRPEGAVRFGLYRRQPRRSAGAAEKPRTGQQAFYPRGTGCLGEPGAGGTGRRGGLITSA